MSQSATERKASPAPLFIDPDLCDGCLACVRACVNKALRVKDGLARILEDFCLGCGVCIQSCPQHAILPRNLSPEPEQKFTVKAIIPSPVLYTQFGPRVSPNDVLLALLRLGYDYVFDQAYYCEWVSLAIDRAAREWEGDFPAISTTCPAVTRLIQLRYHSLIPNLLEISPPRLVAARMARRILMDRLGLPSTAIGLYHITPCPAKCMEVGVDRDREGIDMNLGLDAVYGHILRELKNLTPDEREQVFFKGSGFGIGWEMSGGEAQGLRHMEGTLSVCGPKETVEVLDLLEAGRLHRIKYLECRMCEDGCLGGPLTVANRFQARETLRKLVGMFGPSPRAAVEDIEERIHQGFFQPMDHVTPLDGAMKQNPLKALGMRAEADRITARLPGWYCSACGAPDCRTLAEDVVAGRAKITDCPFIKDEKLKNEQAFPSPKTPPA